MNKNFNASDEAEQYIQLKFDDSFDEKDWVEFRSQFFSNYPALLPCYDRLGYPIGDLYMVLLFIANWKLNAPKREAVADNTNIETVNKLSEILKTAVKDPDGDRAFEWMSFEIMHFAYNDLLLNEADVSTLKILARATYELKQLYISIGCTRAIFDHLDEHYKLMTALYKIATEQAVDCRRKVLERLAEKVRDEYRKTGHLGPAYQEYLSTPEWKEKSSSAFERAKHHCQRPSPYCSGSLQVHHLSYDHIPYERPQDLIVLCDYHHREMHRKLEKSA